MATISPSCREGFQAILDTLYFWDWQMMVVVEGRWPCCWSCKQVGHLGKVCPQRMVDSVQRPGEAEINNTNNFTYTTGTTDTTKCTTSKTTDTTNATLEETSNEWMQVTQRRKKKGERPPWAPAPKESTPTKAPPPLSPVTQRISHNGEPHQHRRLAHHLHTQQPRKPHQPPLPDPETT